MFASRSDKLDRVMLDILPLPGAAKCCCACPCTAFSRFSSCCSSLGSDWASSGSPKASPGSANASLGSHGSLKRQEETQCYIFVSCVILTNSHRLAYFKLQFSLETLIECEVK